MTTRSQPLPADVVSDALGSLRLSADELESFTDSLNRRWHRVLRYRREALPAQSFTQQVAVPWYRLARRTISPADASKPSRCLAYAAADYYLQDAGSLLALAAAGADTSKLADGLLICDLCAAPGGKASALVEAIGDRGFVLANEPIRSRVPALQYNLARTGSDRYAVSGLDPQVLAARVGAVFDRVIVDAPCSGQALMSRGRQTAAAMSAKQIAHSALRQNRILDAAMRLLRRDGRLIYSTCTFAEAENEAQVRRLVEMDVAESVVVDRLAEYQSNDAACYRLWPHRNDCAGSFAASLRSIRDGVAKTKTRRHKPDKPPTDLDQWFQQWQDSIRIRTMDSVIVGWPNDAPPWIDDLAITGPELAHRTGQTWKPAHAASLRRFARGASRCSIEVDAETAKRFVAGETIACPQRGWQVVRYASRPLGWVKSNGTLGKNHLPPSARMSGQISD